MKKRGRNIIIQIIEEDLEENKKNILIELQNLSNEINYKELENILQNSIAKLSNINKREIPEPKKTNQEISKIWNNRLSRAFWLIGLNISEDKDSIIRFYPSHYTIRYK